MNMHINIEDGRKVFFAGLSNINAKIFVARFALNEHAFLAEERNFVCGQGHS